MTLRLVDIERKILIKNDDIAARLRERFAISGTLVVNLLSSPGSGKTTLLEATLHRLAQRYRVAALVGDQATDNDARRLARSGAPVRQITTAAECRLDAEMISRALRDWEPGRLDAFFIENVGNLICPAEYDLGEDLRVVLFSVTEGEDKPLKYPLAFSTSQVAAVTKIDVADAVGFDAAAAHASMRAVNPQIEIVELSARTGAGFDAWIRTLETRIAAKSRAPARV
ncbi:hydrogenase nickel incorporation protein HypB [Vulcanimicrobium alpinum]|uniref:Hydrogenase nickel incorporation protein HypB n=1 Tax=Vulcanimicrobium alpinum TaxID=3016050 RepID=A0AAN2CAC4_UNVUL|nr:hydrogenase nickel incorporation protein HypB [Vulcanimicrobium alpinum]BDE06522.1 hydrogenase nickel incorporation protein HypB [Vulcanimicrobium alpinum]